MAHLALYREWRPKVFDEVVEQKHAVFALRQSVISGQIAHAYLFSGTRGTGKTTLAKIFARAINCLQPQTGNPCNECAICRGMLDGSLMDIVEMDAASNNSVDSIRRICDEVVYMPSQAKFKVYIIDEVHMLSTSAFNALLKTLEEPPAHAVFILATTEPHRIPATILSRCQRYEFRRIPTGSMIERLMEIAAADGIEVDPDALEAIASLADGAMRDAISLLDQARASFSGRISRDDILSLAGVVQDEFMQQMAQALLVADAPALLGLVDQLVMAGRDIARFVTDLAQYFRNILVCRISEKPELLVRAAKEAIDGMNQLAKQARNEQLVDLIKGLSALLSDLRWAADSRTVLEIGLIRLMGSQQAAAPVPVAKVQPPKNSVPALPVQPQAVKKVDVSPEPADIPLPEPPPLAELNGLDEGGPSDLPEPELAAPPIKPADAAEPSPAPKPQVPAESKLTADTDAQTLWQKILDYLLSEGQMTLYLFSRLASPALCGKTLQLHFNADDHVNYHELNQAGSLKILRSAAIKLAEHELDVQPVLAEPDKQDSGPCPAETEGDWIRKIRKTADTLGIPVKMEE